MVKALFPGTFDPPTYGHLDVIQRAAHLFDHLEIAIGTNLSKESQQLFSIEEKIEFLKTLVSGLPNVTVSSFKGLAVNYAKKQKADCIVRGIRPGDLSIELQMALTNRQISGLETVFLIADQKYLHISSSLLRELAFNGADLQEFIPKKILKQVYMRVKTRLRG